MLEKSLESCHEELQRCYSEEEQLVVKQVVALRVEVDEDTDRVVMQRAWSFVSPLWAVLLWIWGKIALFGAFIAIEEHIEERRPVAASGNSATKPSVGASSTAGKPVIGAFSSGPAKKLA